MGSAMATRSVSRDQIHPVVDPSAPGATERGAAKFEIVPKLQCESCFAA